ncbi:MAG TPA: hypothetical protein VJ962_03055 [Clostridia bacterium]|nr:hypothetical protein [Clostridia bacterium]
MSNKNKPLKELSKKEFDESYEELLASHDGKWDKYPLPTKKDLINHAIQLGQISLTKAVKLYGKI